MESSKTFKRLKKCPIFLWFFIFQVDVSSAVAHLMAVKEDNEVALMKKAAQVTSEVFSKKLKEDIISIVDEDKVSLKEAGEIYLSFRLLWLHF